MAFFFRMFSFSKIPKACINRLCSLFRFHTDNLLPVGGCKATPFGCCPDRVTAAEGVNNLGCPPKDPIPTGLCIETDFGCCLDGLTAARGPFLYGCLAFTCRVSGGVGLDHVSELWTMCQQIWTMCQMQAHVSTLWIIYQ